MSTKKLNILIFNAFINNTLITVRICSSVQLKHRRGENFMLTQQFCNLEKAKTFVYNECPIHVVFDSIFVTVVHG